MIHEGYGLRKQFIAWGPCMIPDQIGIPSGRSCLIYLRVRVARKYHAVNPSVSHLQSCHKWVAYIIPNGRTSIGFVHFLKNQVLYQGVNKRNSRTTPFWMVYTDTFDGFCE